MERLRYRSTSLADLQAELRERDLLAEAERARRAPASRQRRTIFGLPIRRRRPWEAERG